jgi:tetratricopeptide (TPR) repeat protein
MSKGSLDQLIASLSKNEKAYFKRWLPSTDKRKKFVDVYQLMEKHPTISTSQLISKLGKGITPKKVNAFKSHLWSSLLLSLRDYHRNKDLQLEFNSRSDAIKILRAKGQLKDALKSAEALLKDCEEIGMIPEAIKTVEHLENIYALSTIPDEEAEGLWDDLYRKKEALGLQIAESSRIRSVERKLKLINDRLGSSLTVDEHKELAATLRDRLVEIGVSNTASIDIKFRYFQSLAIIARIFENREEEQKWFKEVFLALEANQKITNTYYTTFYMVALHNYVDALLFARSLKQVPALLSKMNDELGRNPSNLQRDLLFFANDSVNYHILSREYETALSTWIDFEEKLERDDNPRIDLYIRFMTLGAVAYFWNEDWRKALTVLRNMFKLVDRTEEKEFVSIARTVEIICNYEMGDEHHTEHLCGNFLRKASDLGSELTMEMLIIQAISKQIIHGAFDLGLWQNLLNRLTEISKNPDEEMKLMTFDFISYVQGKTAKSN